MGGKQSTDCADFPYARFDAEGRMIRKYDPEIYQAKMADAVRKHEVEAVDDYVHDPRYAVPVSRFGRDKGALSRGGDMVEIADPADPGERIEVRKFRGGLAGLHASGTIDDDMLAVGADFQAHFEVSGYCHVTTVNLAGEGIGGGGGLEGHMTRTQHSRNKVRKYLDVLGWPNTQHAKAAWWIIGHGVHLEELARLKDLHDLKGGADKAYWRAMTVAALQVMAIFYAGDDGKRKPARMRSSRPAGEDEFKVPDPR